MMILTLLVLSNAAWPVDLDDSSRTVSRTKDHEAGERDERLRSYAEQWQQPSALPGEKADITLHQVYAMYFGTLCDNDGYVVLDHNDTIVEDPNMLVYGGATFSAEINLTGDPFRAVRIGCTSPGGVGMTLTDFTSNYGVLPLTGLTFDGTGALKLHLGARLTLSPAAQPGDNQTISYTITALYE